MPSGSPKTYADQFCDWLVEEGYTHCFFVAGGNIMHLLNSARTRFTCIPVVHEVAAGIATEYFNEVSREGRAFSMVTAGPGLTNILTAMAGAWLESRELLVVGGQVKHTDLATNGLRQRGIQEIDGMALAAPVSVATLQIRTPVPATDLLAKVRAGHTQRPGPVFVEFCLDAQAAPPLPDSTLPPADVTVATSTPAEVEESAALLQMAERPVLLLGGGVSRADAAALVTEAHRLGLPLMTTWNGADRVAAGDPLYWGRPNTWGQRAANVLIQQADLIIAAGSRLGLQQTGFNWQGFAPVAKIVQIDIDPNELAKGHPRITKGICADAARTASDILAAVSTDAVGVWSSWRDFGANVLHSLPTNEDANTRSADRWNPYDFVQALSAAMDVEDVLVPCSSGGAFTVTMQAFEQRAGQRIVTDKGLASMGYGLSGAIGAAYASPGSRVVLVEGDGGFAQNLQEIGTVAVSGLPVKIFLFANDGYASIRMTQRNYFNGAWVGCDTSTGLGLPHWAQLFGAYGVPCYTLDEHGLQHPVVRAAFESDAPAGFIVPIDPEQTYFPKISSHVLPDGAMRSASLHLMTPALPDDVRDMVLRHIETE